MQGVAFLYHYGVYKMRYVGALIVGSAMAVCLLSLSRAHADAITIDPDTDARFVNTVPDGNWDDFLLTAYNDGGQAQRSVLAFDLSGIPAGQVVDAATLTLYVPDSSLWSEKNPAGQEMQVFRITASWVENQVTWNSRYSGQAWTNAGGDYVGTTGVPDSNPYAISTANSAAGEAVTWDITTLVSQWHQGTYANYGLLLLGQPTNYTGFNSSNSDSLGPNPKVEISYSPVPEPATLLLLGTGALGVFGYIRRQRKN